MKIARVCLTRTNEKTNRGNAYDVRTIEETDDFFLSLSFPSMEMILGILCSPGISSAIPMQTNRVSLDTGPAGSFRRV